MQEVDEDSSSSSYDDEHVEFLPPEWEDFLDPDYGKPMSKAEYV